MHPLYLMLVSARDLLHLIVLAHPHSSTWCALDAINRALAAFDNGAYMHSLNDLIMVRNFVTTRVDAVKGVAGFEDDLLALTQTLGVIALVTETLYRAYPSHSTVEAAPHVHRDIQTGQ